MDCEQKYVIVLGSIKNGANQFKAIQKITKIDPKELDNILQKLEEKELIKIQEKKGWFGIKILIHNTDKGNDKVGRKLYELENNWSKMMQIYKSGDKQKLNEQLDNSRAFFPMMMFFGIIDLVMFSMMFNMIGASMIDYIPADQIPADMNDSDVEETDDGGFDFDIGF